MQIEQIFRQTVLLVLNFSSFIRITHLYIVRLRKLETRANLRINDKLVALSQS